MNYPAHHFCLKLFLRLSVNSDWLISRPFQFHISSEAKCWPCPLCYFVLHFVVWWIYHAPEPRPSFQLAHFWLSPMRLALEFWCEVRKLYVMLAVCNISVDVRSKLLPTLIWNTFHCFFNWCAKHHRIFIHCLSLKIWRQVLYAGFGPLRDFFRSEEPQNFEGFQTLIGYSTNYRAIGDKRFMQRS